MEPGYNEAQDTSRKSRAPEASVRKTSEHGTEQSTCARGVSGTGEECVAQAAEARSRGSGNGGEGAGAIGGDSCAGYDPGFGRGESFCLPDWVGSGDRTQADALDSLIARRCWVIWGEEFLSEWLWSGMDADSSSRAEIIKVEHPTRGDDTRAWGPPYAEYEPGE